MESNQALMPETPAGNPPPVNVRIVLVNTTHPGNIGAIARAMKTMCLDQLYLVEPERFPSAEASARASGADDLLSKAVVCDTLEQALEGCSLVIGASARTRSINWPQFDPRGCAYKVMEEHSQHAVAIVFGREHSGLNNHELGMCQYRVYISANTEYGSLNIGAAVQIIVYELMQARLHIERGEAPDVAPMQAVAKPVAEKDLATSQDMASFYQRMWDLMLRVDFASRQSPKHHARLIRRLQRLFNAARPEKEELSILQGIISSVNARLDGRK